MTNLARILLDRNSNWPQAIAYEDATSTITYGELERRVKGLAGCFVQQGLLPGERVCTYLHDSINSVVVFLATIYAGGVAVPGNPRGRRENIDYQIKLADPRFVISEPLVVDHAVGVDQFYYSQPIEQPVDGGDVAFMLWTSGTTGHAKAVMHGHANAVAGAITTHEAYKNEPGDRLYCTSRFYFCFGLAHGLIQSMWAGCTALLDPHLATPGHVKSNIERFKPTMIFSVPVIYSQLITRSKIGPLDCMCINSGDRLPQALLDAWEKETGQVLINQLGNTEMLIPLTLNWEGTTSVGKPVEGYAFTLVDEEGHELEDNQVGRLLIQGPSRSMGYWRDPEWTRRTYAEWLITGDSFWRDKHGNYHYMGRVGDVIKVSGNWVNPVMIEETLQHHQDIEQAAVISKEGVNGVHRIEAYVVTKTGTTPDNLRRWVLQDHDRHSCPRQFHIVPELPRTDSGKIQRYKLRT